LCNSFKFLGEEMNQYRTFAAAVGLTALLIASATAQPPAAGQSDAVPTTAATVPSGWLERAQNAWRGRTLIGAPVFNDNGQRIATINDLLINDDGVVDRVVLLVTQRRQLVAVAFKQFRFAPSRSLATPVVGRRAWRHMNQTNPTMFGVMLPGATRDSLASMETFSFVPSP
jgi:PRC-barrel domain